MVLESLDNSILDNHQQTKRGFVEVQVSEEDLARCFGAGGGGGRGAGFGCIRENRKQPDLTFTIPALPPLGEHSLCALGM